jgi:hypothetical protein
MMRQKKECVTSYPVLLVSAAVMVQFDHGDLVIGIEPSEGL